MWSDKALRDIRVLELAGLAPGPFLGLLLALYGASVVRIDRSVEEAQNRPSADLLTAHKFGSVPLNLKNSPSLSVLHSLLAESDVLIDPFRPGVLEKLGLGADELLRRYPKLIVVRLTGFRRDGKWKDRAGHDINYLAVSGVLSLLGASDRPPSPPANLLADFAGGGLNALSGVLLALIKRGTSGKGSVVDANMVDGSSFLATYPRLLTKTLLWSGARGTNLLDGGCPYYGCYECKDSGRYVAVGALEPQFFNQLLEGLNCTLKDILAPGVHDRIDKEGWPHMRAVFERRFRQRTRDEWETVFEGRDACVTPVKEMHELEEEGWDTREPVCVRSASQERTQSEAGHERDGVGWSSTGMDIGENEKSILRDWLGWQEGRDWRAERGAVVRTTSRKNSKL